MKNVKIKILSTQGIDNDTSSIKRFCFGTLEKTENGYILKYSEGKDEETTKTAISVGALKTATVIRSGYNSSKLIITEKIRNECRYITPVGEMVLGIKGERVNYLLTASGGEINLCYTIDQNGSLISKNKVKIEIKEV